MKYLRFDVKNGQVNEMSISDDAPDNIIDLTSTKSINDQLLKCGNWIVLIFAPWSVPDRALVNKVIDLINNQDYVELFGSSPFQVGNVA